MSLYGVSVHKDHYKNKRALTDRLMKDQANYFIPPAAYVQDEEIF
jgi:hypothetical protein